MAFKHRQLANNQHEISGLGYIATEAAFVAMVNLCWPSHKSLKNTSTMWWWIAWKDQNPCHETPRHLSSLVDFSAYPYSDDELHAKIHDCQIDFEPWSDFGKKETCMPTSMWQLPSPHWNYQTFGELFTNKCWLSVSEGSTINSKYAVGEATTRIRMTTAKQWETLLVINSPDRKYQD